MVDLVKNPTLASAFAADEAKKPNSFTITYGEKTRSAWGYITGRKDVGFWFLKQQQSKRNEPKKTDADAGAEADADAVRVSRAALVAGWPEPIKQCATTVGGGDGAGDARDDQTQWWEHGIEDRAPLARWSRENVTLVGDACHATTPNMGP